MKSMQVIEYNNEKRLEFRTIFMKSIKSHFYHTIETRVNFLLEKIIISMALLRIHMYVAKTEFFVVSIAIILNFNSKVFVLQLFCQHCRRLQSKCNWKSSSAYL